MEKIQFRWGTIVCFLMIFNSCKNAVKEPEALPPKTTVQIVTIGKGNVANELEFSGTTIYLKRNIVTSFLPAFVTSVLIKLGDKVKKGDVLYTLQTKESRSLGSDIITLDSTLKGFGLLKIKASASGIIATIERQQVGEYVQEGTQLCSIAESNDLVFQVNVPYEYAANTKPGNNCNILLPDNNTYRGTFTRALTNMNMAAQTQTILAKSNSSLYLPENMVVKITISKGNQSSQQVLPKSCVSSDEMMQAFWVMKLINDTTAIKIAVKTGNKNATLIEIISPVFSTSDRIISVGNYGLPDTANIKIAK